MLFRSNEIHFTLNRSQEWHGKKVVVTAGPTREAVDPVRYLSNRSCGKMGFALAEEALLRGAEVVLITGPVTLHASARIQTIAVETARDMANAVEQQVSDADVLIMAAAVSDFEPAHVADQKIKKSAGVDQLELKTTPDILKTAGFTKGKRIHVGFSLETENEMQHSLKKMREKQCDLMVMNNPLEKGAGFDVDTNKVSFLFQDGTTESLPLMSKTDVAKEILNRLEPLMSSV